MAIKSLHTAIYALTVAAILYVLYCIITGTPNALLAVIVLVGPIFISFFIVPKLEWLFWGWFRAFIQYAFYQVVAHAFVFVFGQLGRPFGVESAGKRVSCRFAYDERLWRGMSIRGIPIPYRAAK
jgi:hypothetical protein